MGAWEHGGGLLAGALACGPQCDLEPVPPTGPGGDGSRPLGKVLRGTRGRQDSAHSPGPRHVGTQLLQQALPVAHVQVGAPGPNLALDALEDDLQLAVRLPLEDRLHVGADRGVDALSPLACGGEGVCARGPGLGPPTCPPLPAPEPVEKPGGCTWQPDCWLLLC